MGAWPTSSYLWRGTLWVWLEEAAGQGTVPQGCICGRLQSRETPEGHETGWGGHGPPLVDTSPQEWALDLPAALGPAGSSGGCSREQVQGWGPGSKPYWTGPVCPPWCHCSQVRVGGGTGLGGAACLPHPLPSSLFNAPSSACLSPRPARGFMRQEECLEPAGGSPSKDWVAGPRVGALGRRKRWLEERWWTGLWDCAWGGALEVLGRSAPQFPVPLLCS